ncbi:MAG: hypothetical protein K0S27_437 [Gammaproteobacteria bacterium]|jgi:predicted alpha/beta-fold hydrolase|nr:hypothetical protein [Gammaproteobacteria bacterium]
MDRLSFKPAWWLTNSHCQTLWPVLCRRRIKNLPLKRERVELADGDFIDLDWVGGSRGPIVLILHGLEGSVKSPYVQGMLQTILQQGWRGVCMHFRSCSGELNRLPRVYHSGETLDITEVVNRLRQHELATPMAAIGFSLGGNVLLKWLGETGEHNPLTAAIAISVPFQLSQAASRIDRGFSKIYQWRLLHCLRKKIQWKFPQQTAPFNFSSLRKLRTLRDFDDYVTAPLHGFINGEDYYTQSSSRQYLAKIKVPTLILQAKDDPLVGEQILPEKQDISSQIMLEISEKGGHVGFISGRFPWKIEYWLEQRASIFLQDYLKKTA